MQIHLILSEYFVMGQFSESIECIYLHLAQDVEIMYIILLLKISILEFAQMHCMVTKQKKTKKNNSLCTKCMKVDKPRLKNTINLFYFYKVQKGCIQEQWTQFQRDLGIKFPVLWLSFVIELHLA